MKTASRNTGSTMPSRLQVVLALGTTQTLAFGSTYYLPAILAVPMADALDLGTGTVYAAFSLALLVSGLLGPMIGRRIDRLGGRDVLVVSNLLFALGLGLLGVAEEPVLLFAAWLIIGIGMGMGLYEAAFATLAGLYGHAARNPITGITLIAGFASTVAWPLTAWLDLAVGWRGACLFWSAIHLVVCLPLNRFLVPKPVLPVLPPKSETAGDTAVAPRPRFRPGEIRIIATLGFVFAAAWFVSTALAAHLPRLLTETGVTPATALAAAMFVGPAQVAARMVEFAFLQRFHPLVSARLATMLHPLGAAALLLVGAPAAFAFTILHGAGNGILTIAKGTLPLSLFGPEGYGWRQGLIAAPSRIAQAAAPFLMALAIDRLGQGALYVTSALILAACVALFTLPRTTPARSPSAAQRAD
jgi:MFS family permease